MRAIFFNLRLLIWAAGLVLGGFATVSNTYAALTVTGVTYTYATQINVATVYVLPSATVTANVTVSMTGGSTWAGTGWRIRTTSGGLACINTGNTAVSPSTIAISTTVSATGGAYNGYFVAYTNNTCTTGTSATFTATNSVIVDSTVPTIPTATIASNNASPTWAKTGDIVTLTFTVNDNNGLVRTPVVTIRGGAATVSGSYPNFTATRTMLVTDTEGVVPFTVNVTDLAGNAATQRTTLTSGSSVTFDRTAPTIPTATIASNNATPTLAKTGDIVTLLFTTNDANGVQTPVVTIAGVSATVSGGPTSWTATHTMGAGDTEGTVAFTINVNDPAGNAATQRTAITSGSNVTFDRTAPTLSPVTIASNNANTALAKVGDTVTLTFTASESVKATPTVTIAGHAVTPTPAGPGVGPYTATYIMVAGDTAGVVPFTINFTDLAGNAGTQVTATTNGSSVTFDKTVPTLSTVTIASNNANTALAKVGDTVTLTFTASKSVKATPTVTIAGHAVTPTPAGPGAGPYTATYIMVAGDTAGVVPFTINFTDLAGNAGTQVTATTNGSSVTFDKTVPTLSPVTIASNNANTALAIMGNTVTLTFTASESVQATPTVTIAGHAVTPTPAGPGVGPYTATWTMVAGDTEGVVPFTINFTDLAGDAGTQVTSTTNGSSVTFDKTAPTVSSINRANPDPTTAASVSWTVIFSENVTGVDATDFALAATGVSGAFITAVTGSGTTWTVTANTGIGSGTLGLNLVDNDTVIDVASNPLGGAGAGNGNFTGQVYTITATPALVEYRMDQGSWNGTANEVVDSSGGGLHAVAINAASTTGGSNSEALTGNPGTCRYGVFDNASTITQGYVLTPLPDLITDFTVTAWIRTTDNTVPAQRILIDDQGTGPATGYGISLGDGGAGKIRFYSRGITPVIFDSAYTIVKDTWYFVGVVADITNKKRTIYVFDTAGVLLNSTTEAAWTAGAWGTDAGPVSIGAETNASIEIPAANHFKGNLDEVRIYQKVLSQAAVTAIATQTHGCPVVIAVPNHYELSLPTNSIACLATTVTVTACTDATSPCTNPFAAASGTTAILATSGGTLGVTPMTFGATGVATTTLSYPAAPDNTLVTVTLSGETMAASNPRQCCPNGTSCAAANSCSTTFNTAGFIVSAAAGGGVAMIPTQVAGVTSAANYLRAVKTSPTTQACEVALTGTSAVNFAYECNNPTSCYTSNLMSVNGGTATTIARNNNGSVSSYLPVNMTFDANGNAPFTFNYSDVGQVKLWVSKSPSGTLLSTLTGSSNSFVVKPGGFVISNIKQTVAPQLLNPAAANAAGAKFVKAGENFTMNVSATTTPASGATITPNYGNELAPEGVKLTSTLVAPAGGAAGTFSGTFGGFTSGVATGTAFTWSEVGIIAAAASVGDADYLGAGDTTGTTSVNIGRFFPDHLDTVVTAQGSPVGFAYSGFPVGPVPVLVPGQPFTVAVTAKNLLGAPSVNYNYAGGSGFSKGVNLSSLPVGTGQLYVDAVAGGAVPAAKFLNLNPGEGKVSYSDVTGKISFVFSSLPYYLAAPIQIHAEDADTVTSSGANGNINIRHGRLRVFNAFGSEKAALSLPLQAQYWSGNSWLINADDNFTIVPNASIALSVVAPATLGTSVSGTGPISLAAGQGNVVLAIPTAGATGNTGSVDLAINLDLDLGTPAPDQSCLSSHPATTGAAIPWLRSINGNCAATYDRDPSARGSFGIYAPETRRTIHMRELF